MDDLISRLAAITLPIMPKEHREYQTNNLDDAYEQGWDDLQKCIELLPSAVVHAHWWRYSYDEAICSNCGYDRDTYFEHSEEADEKWGELPMYCENCGARMDGKEKEDEE